MSSANSTTWGQDLTPLHTHVKLQLPWQHQEDERAVTHLNLVCKRLQASMDYAHRHVKYWSILGHEDAFVQKVNAG